MYSFLEMSGYAAWEHGRPARLNANAGGTPALPGNCYERAETCTRLLKQALNIIPCLDPSHHNPGFAVLHVFDAKHTALKFPRQR